MEGTQGAARKAKASKPPATSRQVIIVDAQSYDSFHATLYTYNKTGSTHTPVFSPMDAVIGRNGMAPPGQKREGDDRTPSGTYPLLYAFGYTPTANTRMPYQQATKDDVWVDDPNSPQYNQWVHGQPQAASYEVMRREDSQYKYGVVVGYNTERVPGLGSAIFLHVWRGPNQPTAGCVAFSEENMIRLLAWLNPEAQPIIIMGMGAHAPAR